MGTDWLPMLWYGKCQAGLRAAGAAFVLQAFVCLLSSGIPPCRPRSLELLSLELTSLIELLAEEGAEDICIDCCPFYSAQSPRDLNSFYRVPHS